MYLEGAAQNFSNIHICTSTVLLACTAVALGIFAIKGKVDNVNVDVSEQSPFCVRFRLEAFKVNISQNVIDADIGINDVRQSLWSVQIDASSSKASRPCNDNVGPFVKPDIDIWDCMTAMWVVWMLLAVVKICGLRYSHKLATSIGGSWHAVIETSLLVLNMVMNMLLAPVLGMRAQGDDNTMFSEFSQSLFVAFIIIAVLLVPCWLCAYSCSLDAAEPEAMMWGSAQCGFVLATIPLGILLVCALGLVIVYLSQCGFGALAIVVAFEFDLHFTLGIAMVGSLHTIKLARFIGTLMQAMSVAKAVINVVAENMSKVAHPVAKDVP